MLDKSQPVIRLYGPAEIEQTMAGLAGLLADCVADGASISFVMPFSRAEAEAFWRDAVMPHVAGSTRVLLVAECEGRIAGAVQLDTDTPPNQPHRGEIRKLIVHPDFRRRGIARSLMSAIEDHARQAARSLLTLDTSTGSKAEPLYLSLGYEIAGRIPDYSLDPLGSPRLDSTTILYKRL